MRLAALLCALAAACAPLGRTPRTVVVVEDGWAPLGAAGTEEADRRALGDALLRAVERAAGASIAARTRLRNGAAASQRMLSDVSGCVLRYEVLSREAHDGGRRARVRASVSTEPGPCAGRSPLPPAALDDAAVSLSVAGSGDEGEAGARAAEAALRAALAGKGWRVVPGPAPLRLVGGAASTRVKDPRLGRLTGMRVALSLRVEASADGRVLREEAGRGAAVDADAAGAAQQAARAAAEETVAGLSEALEKGLWDIETRN